MTARSLAPALALAMAACAYDPPGHCSTSAECTTGESCSSGVCVGCSSDADCGPSSACNPARLCVSACLVNHGGCSPNASCTPASATTPLLCTCNSGYAGNGQTCDNVAGALGGLRWELPCTGPADAGFLCATSSTPVVVSRQILGPPGKLYAIGMRFRGVVEPRAYSGGSYDGVWWQIGGNLPSRDNGFNIYRLEISSPPQTYYLNSNPGQGSAVSAIDYSKVVTANGGATVTLTADPVDSVEIRNLSQLVIPGIPPAPAAVNGQFIQMDLVSVTER